MHPGVFIETKVFDMDTGTKITMKREKTGGVQKGFKKHGEDVKPLHVRVPVSLLDALNQLPGIKSENVIEALRDFLKKKSI